MPQEFKKNPQELDKMQKDARKKGLVFAHDKVTVYATRKLVDHKSIPEIKKVGQPLEVHPVQAEKLINDGKATKEQPEGVEENNEGGTNDGNDGGQGNEGGNDQGGNAGTNGRRQRGQQ